MSSYLEVGVDIETLDKYDSAVITRIAITPFRFDEVLTYDQLLERTLYISLNQQEQLDKGRTIGKDTMEWWSKQTEELRKESYYPSENDLCIADAYDEIKRFLKSWNYNHYNSHLWARNCGFECWKLQHLNEMFFPGEKQIFNNWKWMEVKTFNYILTGGNTEKHIVANNDEIAFQYHNAKHDSSMDVLRMLELWHSMT